MAFRYRTRSALREMKATKGDRAGERRDTLVARSATGGSGTGMWVRYQPPHRDALIRDIIDVRQTGMPATAINLRARHALFHSPAVAGIEDLDHRALVLADLWSQAFTHESLTDVQRLIGRYMFLLDPSVPQTTVSERRLRAVDEIASTIVERGRPVRMTARQVEDRETRIVATVVDLFSDPTFGPPPTGVPLPANPRAHDGYVWIDSTHIITMDATNPTIVTSDEIVKIRALRERQALFNMVDSTASTDDLGRMVIDPTGEQRLVATIDERQPFGASQLVLVHLGRNLAPGDTATVHLRNTYRSDPLECELGLHAGETNVGQRLELRAHIPAALGCTTWTEGEWEAQGTVATEIRLSRHSARPGEDTVASMVVDAVKLGHYYLITWSYG
jgi:hypothetical protein